MALCRRISDLYALALLTVYALFLPLGGYERMMEGKYRAFLEAQAQNPDLTTEDVQGMTMREIRDLIQPQESQTGSGQKGGGKGHGKGWAGGRHNS